MNIMYITGTRADYGRMKPLLKKLENSKNVNLKVIVTGMHLKREFGNTYLNVLNDLKTNVDLFDAYENYDFACMSTTPLAISNMIDYFTKYIILHQIKYVILFGDRSEMLAGAISAAHLGVKIFHIAGGDFSGSIDDKYRDIISIFADHHFVALKEHQEKLLNMNINRDNIYLVGALDISALVEVKNIDSSVVLSKYGIRVDQDYCIMIFHPDVYEVVNINEQLSNVLTFLVDIDISVIVILPNSDYGKNIITEIYTNIDSNNFYFFENILYEDFINMLRHSKFIIGNSSSGIIEASHIPIAAINIGNRQNNRIKGGNVINTDASIESLKNCYERISTSGFKLNMERSKYLYGDGKTIDLIYDKIYSIIKSEENKK